MMFKRTLAVFLVCVAGSSAWATTTRPWRDVKAYGAAGDGKTLDTAAIQKALDAGGEILFSPGTYLTGSLFIKSNTRVHIRGDVTILGSESDADYPIIKGRWEGVERDIHAGLINAIDAKDIEITGGGTVDGRGKVWWDRLKAKGEKLKAPRPRLLYIMSCSNVLLNNLTLKDSPSWTVHLLYCKTVTVDSITVLAPPRSPNTDGIDPDSSEDITIRNCKFDCGDDCIAIKSGRDADGRRVNRPCKNITIEKCIMLHGHGAVALGSETAGGISNVRVRECTFNGTDSGVRLKSTRGRGGVVEDVVFERIKMTNMAEAIQINMYYYAKMDGKPQPIDEATPTFRNIRLLDIEARDCKSAGRIYGLPERPVMDLKLQDVRIEAIKGLDIKWAKEIELKNVKVTAAEGEPIKSSDVEWAGLK